MTLLSIVNYDLNNLCTLGCLSNLSCGARNLAANICRDACPLSGQDANVTVLSV